MSDQPQPLPQSSRRRDVFTQRAALSPVRRRRGPREPGTDFHGRYVGPFDIDRGLEFFWRSRKGSAPIVRNAPDHFGASRDPRRPRSLDRSGLNFEKLREIHALRKAGATLTDLAIRFEVSLNTLSYHLRGSASMHAALAHVNASA